MVQWNKKRRQATFCEMPACNNGSYAVHISHVKWNNGAMHKNYNKMIQTSNGDTVHRNKTRMCHYVMNTKSMCYIHTLSSNNWTSHMDVLVGGTPNIHRQLHVYSIKIRGEKKSTNHYATTSGFHNKFSQKSAFIQGSKLWALKIYHQIKWTQQTSHDMPHPFKVAFQAATVLLITKI